MNIIILFLLYLIIMIGIAWWYRSTAEVDDFLMARRQAGTVNVTASIFTLIGGGELATLATVGFVYGWSAISLFLGYSVAFVILAFLASKIRSKNIDGQSLSLPDYIHDNHGYKAGTLVFAISFIAFFALLLIQFTAGGQLLSPITGLGYKTSVLITAIGVALYLLIGGFNSVLKTDVVQGFAMVLILPTIIWILFDNYNYSITSIFSTNENFSWFMFINFSLTGLFVALSSADVWQRIYAAKSDTSASRGLIYSSILFILFGIGLIGLGTLGSTFADVDPNSILSVIITEKLSGGIGTVAILLVLCAITSTADTELFLLTGIASKEISRSDKFSTDFKESINNNRWLLVTIGFFAVLFSLYLTDLVGIYSWLLYLLMVMSPAVIGSLWKYNVNLYYSIVTNLFIFISLILLNLLTLDTAWLIVIPGFLVYFMQIWSKKRAHKNEFGRK